MADKVFDEYLAKTELDNLETDGTNTQTKKVSLYGFDTTDLTKKRITVKETDGEVGLNVSGSELQSIAGLSIPAHDTRELVYTDGVLTSVVYKLGGAIVATKTLTYTGTDLTGITIL